MQISQALNLVSTFSLNNNALPTLGDVLDPELISQCLAETGTVTFRKRRLPMDMMVWCVVGMALERQYSLHQIVNRLDILLPGNRPFVAPSAVIQARQRLGAESGKRVLVQTSQYWQNQSTAPHWAGLTLLAVDGVIWRTPDTPENSDVFSRTTNQNAASLYPQVKMVCQMELTSHLLTAAELGTINDNEMKLAERLIDKTPDQSVTLFDKGYYSLGLLDEWQKTGEERHWMIAMRKDTQYEIVRKLGKEDWLIAIKTSPQSRKKWPDLAQEVVVRMVEKTIKGKPVRIMTSMTDALRYPGRELADLYSYRWEIELGYREIKQTMQQNRLTLRSKKPEMIKQELWGILIGYNLIRYQMIKMAATLKGVWANQLSFTQSTLMITNMLGGLPYASPGRIPELLRDLESQAKIVLLPTRRERSYPRMVKERPSKYPTVKRKNASQC